MYIQQNNDNYILNILSERNWIIIRAIRPLVFKEIMRGGEQQNGGEMMSNSL